MYLSLARVPHGYGVHPMVKTFRVVSDVHPIYDQNKARWIDKLKRSNDDRHVGSVFACGIGAGRAGHAFRVL